jgi:hypothetical protein
MPAAIRRITVASILGLFLCSFCESVTVARQLKQLGLGNRKTNMGS